MQAFVPPSLSALESERARLVEQFLSLGDFRTGTVSAAARRCGKPTCRCARSAQARHPQFRLLRKVKGKTVAESFASPAEFLKAAQQVAEFHRFQDLVAELGALNEQICRLRPVASDEAAGPRPRRNGCCLPSRSRTGSPEAWPSSLGRPPEGYGGFALGLIESGISGTHVQYAPKLLLMGLDGWRQQCGIGRPLEVDHTKLIPYYSILNDGPKTTWVWPTEVNAATVRRSGRALRRPLRVGGTELPANVLLMAKTVVNIWRPSLLLAK